MYMDRLDSGDLAYLSAKIRGVLDREGLNEVQIAVSNQLDESIIHSLQSQNAPIDLFGVGTRLVTGKPDSALGGGVQNIPGRCPGYVHTIRKR
ncbi:MAG: hypothetical protein WD315_00315 [Balneolaceae bacterium]